MTIEFYSKNVYGIEKFYLIPSNVATGFQMLTGKKTFDTKDQRGIAAIVGEKVIWKQVLPPKGN